MTGHEREDYYDRPAADVTFEVDQIDATAGVLVSATFEDKSSGSLWLDHSVVPDDIHVGDTLTAAFSRPIPPVRNDSSPARSKPAGADTVEYP